MLHHVTPKAQVIGVSLGLVLLLATTPSDAEPAESPIVALVNPADHISCVRKASRSRLPSPGPLMAGSWTALRTGDRLLISDEGSVRLLCPDGGCRRESRGGVIDAAVCERSSFEPCGPRPSPSSDLAATSAADSPRQSLVEMLDDWALHGRWLLRGHPRDFGDELGRGPVLLSPRCPELGRSTPSCQARRREPSRLIFSAVPGASSYHFAWTGTGHAEPLVVAAEAVQCAPRPEFDGERLCRLPWPDAWRLPPPGRVARLMAGATVDRQLLIGDAPSLLAKTDRAVPIPANNDGPFSPGSAEARAWRRLQLQRLGLLGELHDDLVDEVYGSGSSPALDLLIAESWFDLGLLYPATWHLARVLAPASRASARATAFAELGMAASTWARDDTEAARRHLAAAHATFERLGDPRGLATVRRWRQLIDGSSPGRPEDGAGSPPASRAHHDRP